MTVIALAERSAERATGVAIAVLFHALGLLAVATLLVNKKETFAVGVVKLGLSQKCLWRPLLDFLDAVLSLVLELDQILAVGALTIEGAVSVSAEALAVEL